MRAAWIANSIPQTVAGWYQNRRQLEKPKKEGAPPVVATPCPTGQFAWLAALDIEQSDIIGRSRLDQLDNYDVAFVTGNPGTWSWIREIKQAAPNITLFATADYALGAGGLDVTYREWPRCIEELDHADVVYAVEPCQQSYLEDVLGRNVHLTNNPVDVEGIKKFQKNIGERVVNGVKMKNHKGIEALVAIHPYGAFRTEYPIDYAYMARAAGPGAFICNVNPADAEKAGLHFDTVLAWKSMPYPAFLQMLMQAKRVWNIHPVPSADRLSLELIALGIPVVGSPTSWAPVTLRPNPWNIDAVRNSLDLATPAPADALDRYRLEACRAWVADLV